MKNNYFVQIIFLVIALLFLMVATQVKAQSTATIFVQVNGATANKGLAICWLFNSKETYLKEPYRIMFAAIDGSGEAECIFEAIVNGTYAVSVIYDKNSDGKLNTNFLGIPTEPVGMSNNPKSSFGPPGFDKAKFELELDKELIVQLTGI